MWEIFITRKAYLVKQGGKIQRQAIKQVLDYERDQNNITKIHKVIGL